MFSIKRVQSDVSCSLNLILLVDSSQSKTVYIEDIAKCVSNTIRNIMFNPMITTYYYVLFPFLKPVWLSLNNFTTLCFNV